jgi:hypothetical protein
MDTNQRPTIVLSRNDLLRVLSYLNILVVSLDRIGSACCDVDKQECLQMLDEFLTDWQALQMLAQARKVLSKPFSDELGPDDMDELERAMQHLAYWRSSHRKPPAGFIEQLVSSDSTQDE